jgi:AhpD family alkylhydroperoxidase
MGLDYYSIKPELITRFREMTKEFDHFALDGKLRALVELRVSQINGCVYCVDLHTREARSRGEAQQRLDTLAVWRESPFFDPREKCALAWAEGLTRMADPRAGGPSHEGLRPHFSEQEIVELGLAVALANFWNRMAAGFGRMPSPRDA